MNQPERNKIAIGDVAQVTRVFNKKDVDDYILLTGDSNPIHVDYEYAKRTIFKKPIIHGPLTTTLITTLFATELPGPGSVYLNHNIKYLSPVYINDTITAKLEVIAINEKDHITLKTTCVNQDGKIVIDGIATLKLM